MEYKLSDLFNLQMGKTPDRSNLSYWENGTEQWIAVADLSESGKYIEHTSECITVSAVEQTGIKIIPENTVIMSFKLSIGKVAITPRAMYSNEAIMAFVDKNIIKIDSSYLYYLLMNRKWDDGTNKAVMGKTLNKGTLSNMRISFHDAQEQRSIATVLDKVQEVIFAKQKQIEKLDSLVRGRFVEMFGDPEENPMGWNQIRLSEMINVIGGYAFKSEYFKEGEGIPVLRIGNINTGKFQSKNLLYWQEDKKLERYIIYPGDLVMSLTGTVGKDDYGNVCIMGNAYEKYYLNQRNAKLEIVEGLNKYYLAELLMFGCIKRRLTDISRGVRQANISNKDILNMIVPVPPLEFQEQFADFVTRVNKSKVVIQASIDKLQLLFDSLMQQYFG